MRIETGAEYVEARQAIKAYEQEHPLDLTEEQAAALLEFSHALERTRTAVDDVIQIAPAHPLLGGAFASVTEIHAWGVVAEVSFPGQGVAPVRLSGEEYRRIGRPGWIREPE